MSEILPKGFEDLARFVPEWVHGTERARNVFRVNQSYAALQGFYDAVMPRLEAIAAHLADAPLDRLTRSQGNLLELSLMAMEVAPAIEYYQQPDVPNSVEFEKFEIMPVPIHYRIVEESTGAPEGE